MKASGSDAQFFAEAERVVIPLRDALRDLMNGSAAGNARSVADLPLNATLRTRVTRGIEADDLPTALYYLPGSDGLRRLVQKAKRAGADAVLIERCNKAIEAHEEFLRAEGVSRDSLHALVGDLAPDAQASVIRTSAQAVHKAMCNLIGFSADVMMHSAIVLPGDAAGRCHLAQVSGFCELQRLRVNSWYMTSGYGRTGGAPVAAQTLDRQSVDERVPTTMLMPFCSDPAPKFESTWSGRRQMHRLVEHEVGWRSASTFCFGELLPDALQDPMPEVRTASGATVRRTMLSSIVATPTRHLHFDLLVHRDVWPGTSARLETYRTVPHGPVDEAEIEERAADRIDLGVKLQMLDSAEKRSFGTSKAPRYGEMMQHVFARLGIAPADLRVHRCEVLYPLYGTQFAMVFEG